MTPQQQFVDDYVRVVENDYTAWQIHQIHAENSDKNVYTLADKLREVFEEAVDKRLDKLDPAHDDYFVNIMREMLLGWGISPYENIAREILSRLDEGK